MARSSEAMARRRPVLSGWRLPTGRGGRVARCRWSDGPRQEKAGRENGWRLLWWSLWRGPAPHHGAVPSRRTMVPWSGVVGWVLLALPSRAGRASQGTARPGVGGVPTVRFWRTGLRGVGRRRCTVVSWVPKEGVVPRWRRRIRRTSRIPRRPCGLGPYAESADAP